MAACCECPGPSCRSRYFARAEVTRLDNQERKLLTADYADRITDHIDEE